MKTTLPKFLFLLLISTIRFSTLSAQRTRDMIDSFSTSSCYVVATKTDKRLWNGTGFFININSKFYFITNNHMVGGNFYVNEYTELNKKSPPKDSFPDTLRVRIYKNILNSYSEYYIPLFHNGNSVCIKFWED